MMYKDDIMDSDDNYISLDNLPTLNIQESDFSDLRDLIEDFVDLKDLLNDENYTND